MMNWGTVCKCLWKGLDHASATARAVTERLHALSPWKTRCTGLNLSEKGLCSPVFAESTQISLGQDSGYVLPC